MGTESPKDIWKILKNFGPRKKRQGVWFGDDEITIDDKDVSRDFPYIAYVHMLKERLGFIGGSEKNYKQLKLKVKPVTADPNDNKSLSHHLNMLGYTFVAWPKMKDAYITGIFELKRDDPGIQFEGSALHFSRHEGEDSFVKRAYYLDKRHRRLIENMQDEEYGKEAESMPSITEGCSLVRIEGMGFAIFHYNNPDLTPNCYVNLDRTDKEWMKICENP